MIWPPGLAKKSRPTPGRASGEWFVRGDKVINGNPVKAQGPKGKVRTVLESPKRGPAHFTILLAKGMKGAVDAGVPIKIELGVGADGAGGHGHRVRGLEAEPCALGSKASTPSPRR